MSHAIEVRIALRDGHLPATLVLPEGAGPWPGVVVVHEILGVNRDIRRIAARIAAGGYACVLPDLFAARGARPLCVLRTLTDLLAGGGESFEHLEASRAWLATRPEVRGKRIGVVGFCMGGGFALLWAKRAPFGAAAAFYGDVPRREEALAGICPVVGGYGARDRIFGPQGGRLARHLESLGVEHDVVVYPDAGHSYMSHHEGLKGFLGAISPLRAGHDASASEDSWRRLFAFFARHLQAPGA
jgi:carboxymethylenebutenolidase